MSLRGGATGNRILPRCSNFVLPRFVRTRTEPIPVQNSLYCVIQKTASSCVVPKTVLIADDSASVRLSVRLLLQGRHKELVVREAFDGMDASEKARKSKPDLILLDLSMPRVNGAEAATVLKNDLPDTPVILFTYTDLRLYVYRPTSRFSVLGYRVGI